MAYINDGRDSGKLCVILDVVDQRRVSTTSIVLALVFIPVIRLWWMAPT